MWSRKKHLVKNYTYLEMYVEKLREEIFKAIEASDDPQTVIILSDLFDDVVRLEAIVYESASVGSRELKRTPRYKEARRLYNKIKRSLRVLKYKKRMGGVAASLSNWHLYAIAGAAAVVLFPGI